MWNKIVDNYGLIGAVVAAAMSWGALKFEVSGHTSRLDKAETQQEMLNRSVNHQAVVLERIEYKVDYLRCEVTGKGCGR
jgi:hypothetical protein